MSRIGRIPTLALLLSLSAACPAMGEEADRTESSFIPNYAVADSYFSWNDDADFSGGASGSLGQWETGAEGNVPLWKAEGFRLTGGVRYRFNRLEFRGADLPFGDQAFDLHRVDLPVNLWVDLDDRWKSWVRLQPGLNSDFAGSLDGDDFVLTALALLAWEYSEKLTFAFGGYYSRDLGDETLLPAAGFIWKPDPRWSVGLTAPRIEISHAPTRDWLLTLQAMPSGGGWNIADPSGRGGPDVDLNLSSLRAALSVDRRISGPLWAYVMGGVQFAQELELEGGSVAFDEELDEAFSVQAGVKVRF